MKEFLRFFTKPNQAPLPSFFYEIIAPEKQGEEKPKASYLLGTMHYYFDIPQELVEKLNDEKSITQLLVENASTYESNLKEPKHRLLDEQIALMAESKEIPITSLDRQIPNSLFEKHKIDSFFSPETAVLAKAIEEKLVSLYLGQDMVTLNKLSGTKSAPIISKRNQEWQGDIIPSLRKGGALIVFGYNHLPGNDGYINILKNLGFTVKPLTINISLNKILEEEKATKNRYRKEMGEMGISMQDTKGSETRKAMEIAGSINVSSELSKLAQAYHENKLTSEQQEILNSFLKNIMEANIDPLISIIKNDKDVVETLHSRGILKDSKEMNGDPLKNILVKTTSNPLKYIREKMSDPLSYFEQNPVNGLIKFGVKSQPQSQKKQIEDQIKNHLELLVLVDSNNIKEKLLLKQYCRLFTFYCYLFFPDTLKKLFADYIGQHINFSYFSMEVRLLLMCGMEIPATDECRTYMGKFESGFSTKIEKRAVLTDFFSGEKFPKDAIECILDYSDIPQLPQLGK